MQKKDANPNAKKYCTNADLLPAFLEAKKQGVLTKELALMLQMIAEKYSYHHWFRNYSFRDDMVAEATVNLCKQWHKFDPEKSNNPFSYFTTCAYRSFQGYLAHEREQAEIKDALKVEEGYTPSWNYRAAMAGSDMAFMSVEAE